MCACVNSVCVLMAGSTRGLARDETLQELGFADTSQVSVINYQRGFASLVSYLCRETDEHVAVTLTRDLEVNESITNSRPTRRHQMEKKRMPFGANFLLITRNQMDHHL